MFCLFISLSIKHESPTRQKFSFTTLEILSLKVEITKCWHIDLANLQRVKVLHYGKTATKGLEKQFDAHGRPKKFSGLFLSFFC